MMLNIALIQSKSKLVHISINMLNLKSKTTIVDSHFTLWVLAGICSLDGLLCFYTVSGTLMRASPAKYNLAFQFNP